MRDFGKKHEQARTEVNNKTKKRHELVEILIMLVINYILICLASCVMANV